LRVFLDTNVVVSGFTTSGLCADVVREILAKHTLVISEQVLAETADVLLHRFYVAPDIVAEIISLLRRQEVASVPLPLPDIAIADSDDLAIVAAAIAAKVDFLVSGDKHIAAVAPLTQLRVATPREFWDVTADRRAGDATPATETGG
jgi:uncharacterized protein